MIGKNDVGKSNIIRAIHVACKNQNLSVEDFTKEQKKIVKRKREYLKR